MKFLGCYDMDLSTSHRHTPVKEVLLDNHGSHVDKDSLAWLPTALAVSMSLLVSFITLYNGSQQDQSSWKVFKEGVILIFQTGNGKAATHSLNLVAGDAADERQGKRENDSDYLNHKSHSASCLTRCYLQASFKIGLHYRHLATGTCDYHADDCYGVILSSELPSPLGYLSQEAKLSPKRWTDTNVSANVHLLCLWEMDGSNSLSRCWSGCWPRW